MADGLNRVMLMGNLGAEPELRAAGDTSVLSLRLATNDSWFDKTANERKERTEWHTVVVWGKRGEALAKILHKGSSIFVEGSIRTSSYDDRDGVRRFKVEIVASDVLLAGAKPGTSSASADRPAGGGGGYAARASARAPSAAKPGPGDPEVSYSAEDESLPF